MTAQEFSLPSAPFDSISKVRYSPFNPNHLLAASWDTTVRLYEVGELDGKPSEHKSKFEHRAAVLDCCFSDATHGFSGGLDHSIKQMEFETERLNPLGSHSDAVSTMLWTSSKSALITGSWDRTLRFWDPRAQNPQTSSYNTPERIYQIDMANNKIVVAMASRLFHIYDVRNMEQPEQVRESSLRYMTRSLACMGGEGNGFAIASVEGRIAVEYFDASAEAQQEKYAFKCHRQTVDGVDHVWPVNALAFHPIYNTLASAGSDGTVSIWDIKVKKRLRQYKYNGSPVASIAFNNDGSKLAVATSYTWDEGETGIKTAQSPAIHIRPIGDEVKPKPKEK